jgi:hypothetical protein
MDAQPARLVKRVVLGVTGAAVIATVVSWPFWSARRQWDRLDNAAQDFRVPRRFTEVTPPRQGSGFCWVTCTNGGEAIVTIVLETDYTDPIEACRELRPAIVALTGDGDASNQGTCGWTGQLGGSATVFAGADRAANLRSPYDGHRWTEAAAVPDSPVVAFVEFNSGIE